MVLMLLIRGADINAADGKGYTPLLVALENALVDVALILLNRGASTVLRNNNHMNSLHFAAMSNSVAVCSLLLERGMDINDKDIHGNTPLLIALNKGNVEVSMMLSQVPSADFSIRNREGKTAYDIALSKNMSNIVGRIIECEEILKLKSLRQDEFDFRARQSDGRSVPSEDAKAKAQSSGAAGSASEQQMLADAVRRGMAKSRIENGSGSAGMLDRGNENAETISQITFDMGNVITDNNGNVLREKKEKKDRSKEERERRAEKKKKKREKELKVGGAVDDASRSKSKSKKGRSIAEGAEGEASTTKSGRTNKSSKSSRLRSLLYEDDVNTIMESASVYSKSKSKTSATPAKSTKGPSILDDGRSPELNIYKKASPGFIFCGGGRAAMLDEPAELQFDETDDRSSARGVRVARKSSESSILCGAGGAPPRQSTGSSRHSLAASNRRALEQARREREDGGGCLIA